MPKHVPSLKSLNTFRDKEKVSRIKTNKSIEPEFERKISMLNNKRRMLKHVKKKDPINTMDDFMVLLFRDAELDRVNKGGPELNMLKAMSNNLKMKFEESKVPKKK